MKTAGITQDIPGRDIARNDPPFSAENLRKRHNLLDLTDEGRRFAYEELAPRYEDNLADDIRRLVVDGFGDAMVPGIARRNESPDAHPDLLPVGFTTPWVCDGARMRVSAFVRDKDVVRMTTPYELVEQPVSVRTSCLFALVRVMTMARIMGLEVGVWGSASLELHTGLPYTNDDSDLDLLVRPAPEPKLRGFLSHLERVEQELGLRIDVELDLPNGYGVQLKELARNVNSVLGKGSVDVTLLPQEDVWLLCNEYYLHSKGGL